MKKNYTFYYDILTLLVCIAGITLSRFLMNFGLGMLVFRLLALGSWKEKWENIKRQKTILLVILSFFALHLVGLLWSENLSFGIDEVVRKIAFLIIPITIAAISPLPKETLRYTFWGFILAVLVGTIWGSVVLITTPYADPRDLIFSTSHIRFSLNTVLAILLLAKITIVNKDRITPFFKIISFLLVIWFFTYMVLTQAMTGFVILFIFLAIYFPYYFLKNKKGIVPNIIFTLYIIAIISSSIWVYKEYKFYFTPNEIYKKELLSTTPDKGTYIHNTENKLIENGNYLYRYCCFDEIMREWEKRTGLDANKYLNVLVRYMNSKSPYKDAKRFHELSDKDIENIKNNIANVVYAEKLSIKPRLYKIFYQLNCFNLEGRVKGFSEFQRFELWTNAKEVIKDNFFIGTGTGDIADKFEQKLGERHSELYGSKLKSHNEYLYIFATFGIIGLIIFIFWLIYPAINQGLLNNYIYFVFFFIIILSMLTEDTLDNLAGIMFYIFINCIILFNASTIKEFIPKKKIT